MPTTCAYCPNDAHYNGNPNGLVRRCFCGEHAICDACALTRECVCGCGCFCGPDCYDDGGQVCTGCGRNTCDNDDCHVECADCGDVFCGECCPNEDEDDEDSDRKCYRCLGVLPALCDAVLASLDVAPTPSAPRGEAFANAHDAVERYFWEVCRQTSYHEDVPEPEVAPVPADTSDQTLAAAYIAYVAADRASGAHPGDLARRAAFHAAFHLVQAIHAAREA